MSSTTVQAPQSKSNVRELVTIALLAAILCILAPLSIPIGPVPISLTNLVLYLFVYMVGTRRTTIAYIIYMLLGLVGLPVFSGFAGGVGKLFGPTGGYIIGFVPMIIVMGLFIERHSKNIVACVVVMEASTWIAYLLGTAWLAFSMKMSFQAALATGVLPFIAEDLIKMIAAGIVGPQLRKLLMRSNLAD